MGLGDLRHKTKAASNGKAVSFSLEGNNTAYNDMIKRQI